MLKKLLRDLIKYSPARVIPALTGFMTIPIFTRLFSPGEYGAYVLAFSLSGLLFALSCSGFGSAALRFYPEYKKKSELGKFFSALNFNVVIAMGLTSVLTLLLLSLVKNLMSATLYNLFRISVLVFILAAIFTVYLTISRAKEMGGTYSTFDLLRRFSSLGLGLILVTFFSFKVDGLLWGEFFGTLIFLPVIVYVITKGTAIRWGDFSLGDSRIMLSWAWPLGLGNVSMWCLTASDRFVIGLYLPENEIGLYSIGYQVSAKSIAIIVDLFILSMGAFIVNTWEACGRRETEEAMTVLTRTYLIFTVPACVGLTIIADPIVKILTTEPYYEGYRIIGYVAFSVFFWGLSMIATMGLIIGKKTRLIAFNQFVAAVLNLGLNLILVPRFGFVAAGITTLIGYLVLFLLQTYQSTKQIRWVFPFRTLMNVIVASFVMGIAILVILGFAKAGMSSQVVFILLVIVLSGSLYFASLFALGELSRDELIGIKKTD